MAMVSNIFPTKIESISKPVQDLVVKNEEPPRRCFYDGVLNGVPGCSLPMLEIPVVNVDLRASPTTSREEVEKLHSALTSRGYLMTTNHGVKNSLLDQICSVTKQFYALPMEKKQKYSKEVDGKEDYGNDMILTEDQIPNWSDRLHLLVSREDRRKFKFWPEKPRF